MKDSYYSAPIHKFLETSDSEILGELAQDHHHSLERLQRDAWVKQIPILKDQLTQKVEGHIFIEFSIPRMGKRADVVIVHNNIIFVVEFKTGAKIFERYAIDQVYDYSLDLKNFHLGSHKLPIVPVLVATLAKGGVMSAEWDNDLVANPIMVGGSDLASALDISYPASVAVQNINIEQWRKSGYRPTPTIIEAAEVLYRGHSVKNISRSDASAINLQSTSDKIAEIIEESKDKKIKSICFITGAPGAGKTLAGLNIATKRIEENEDKHAVFLSGNAPLVDVLREALTRDQVKREKIQRKTAERSVKKFIQNIHHFRNQYVKSDETPFEKVIVFDEAQRVWTKEKTSQYMKERGYDNFEESEPEFLLSVMDRHTDWCTVICLIGGGQEINTGEAGIGAWFTALNERFNDWKVHASNALEDRHYTIDEDAAKMLKASNISKHKDLHLFVSMRAFRADEKLSGFVSQLLDGKTQEAKKIFLNLSSQYPVALTRNLDVTRTWLQEKARGGERCGLVASSGAHRLRPEGIYIKDRVNPANWFLNNRFDVRSSNYMEEVATEFYVQGLELDWVGICWDANLRRHENEWEYHAFVGKKWQWIRKKEKQLYLLNTYRVLLTRARQGMIIFVPHGDKSDWTRPPEYYDETFQFLKECGIEVID